MPSCQSTYIFVSFDSFASYQELSYDASLGFLRLPSLAYLLASSSSFPSLAGLTWRRGGQNGADFSRRGKNGVQWFVQRPRFKVLHGWTVQGPENGESVPLAPVAYRLRGLLEVS